MTPPLPPPTPSPSLRPVRVWDLPTRVFHWTLASLVVVSVVSANIGGNAMVWHFRSGYAILALLLFRIVWGLFGGRWSRFASFLYAPATLWRYLRGGVRADEQLEVGHSPLGALSVFALLALLALQVGTGLFADDEIANAGPLARHVSLETSLALTGWHQGAGRALVVALALLHVGAVLFYLLRRGRNLIAPMWNGDKLLAADVPASADTPRTRLLALLVAAGCAGAVGWLVAAA